jgi:hypothetical protein
MTKQTWLAILPSVCSALLIWKSTQDFFAATGYAFWTFVLISQIVLDDKQHALAQDYPSSKTYAIDQTTCVHAVKTALLGATYKTAEWRILQIDPDVGSILAVIDLLQSTPTTDESVRQQILLICEFDQIECKTQLRLRWRVRSGQQRNEADEAIKKLSERIRFSLLSGAKVPA